MSKRVLVSTSTFALHSREPLERLDRAGFSWELNPHGRKLGRAEATELLADKVAVIAGTETLDADVLAAAPLLRVISRVGTGLDNVDLEAASARRIQVFNTPDAPAPAVAELTLAGILALLRNLAESDRKVRQGVWEKPMGRLLRGKTVAIVGLGRIGQALVRLLAPFDVRVLAVDPLPDLAFAERHGVLLASLEEALPVCDVLTLHLGTQVEKGVLVDATVLGALRSHAILVNCARGGLVDEAALADALREGRVAGAFLDVFQEEPYSGPLADLENTILSPHVGSYAVECRIAMELEAVANALRALAGREQASSSSPVARDPGKG